MRCPQARHPHEDTRTDNIFSGKVLETRIFGCRNSGECGGYVDDYKVLDVERLNSDERKSTGWCNRSVEHLAEHPKFREIVDSAKTMVLGLLRNAEPGEKQFLGVRCKYGELASVGTNRMLATFLQSRGVTVTSVFANGSDENSAGSCGCIRCQGSQEMNLEAFERALDKWKLHWGR